MDGLELFRQEVYEKLGKILEERGDQGFISEGPKIVAKFYEKHSDIIKNFETKHTESGYTRKKVICDNGKHAVRFMEWYPKSVSPIHEHGGRPCFDIVIEGVLEVGDFKAVKNKDGGNEYKLEEVKRYKAKPSGFIIVDPKKTGMEIHIVKSLNEKSRSLHFYPIDHRSIGIYISNGDGTFRRENHSLDDD